MAIKNLKKYIDKSLNNEACGKHHQQANHLYVDFFHHDSGTSDSSEDEN